MCAIIDQLHTYHTRGTNKANPERGRVAKVKRDPKIFISTKYRNRCILMMDVFEGMSQAERKTRESIGEGNKRDD
jgi:hypothetical protein